MKKLFSFFAFVAIMISFAACKNGGNMLEVNEANLLGSWQMIAATEGGVREDVSSYNIVWNFFAENHVFTSSRDQQGTWQLTGAKLVISTDQTEWTVSALTTTSLIIIYDENEGDDEGEGPYWVIYEFSRAQ